MGKGVLKFGPDTPMQVSANVVNVGPNGEQILEGDVTITVAPPRGPHRLVNVIKTPNGETRQERVGEARPLTVKAQKVVLTRTPDGGTTLQFERGSIDSH